MSVFPTRSRNTTTFLGSSTTTNSPTDNNNHPHTRRNFPPCPRNHHRKAPSSLPLYQPLALGGPYHSTTSPTVMKPKPKIRIDLALGVRKAGREEWESQARTLFLFYLVLSLFWLARGRGGNFEVKGGRRWETGKSVVSRRGGGRVDEV